MKGLDIGNKNIFIFRFLCLFTFRQHKQLPMFARFFKGMRRWRLRGKAGGRQPNQAGSQILCSSSIMRLSFMWCRPVGVGIRERARLCVTLWAEIDKLN
jgi:hypothetical protein